MSLLQPKYPLISPIKTSVKDDPDGFMKELNEKIELLRQNTNNVYDETGTGLFKPQFGQFHTITKQDCTTNWQDVANLVTSGNIQDVGLSTTGTNITFAATGIYSVSFRGTFCYGNWHIGAIRALKNSTEITASYAVNEGGYMLDTSGCFLVDITSTSDTIHFEYTAQNTDVDFNTAPDAEANPVTVTIFTCIITKIANT